MPRTTRVRALRERLALKQNELAARSGVHRITVGRAEVGRCLGADIVAKLAAALGVRPDEIVLPAPPDEGARPPAAPQSAADLTTAAPRDAVETADRAIAPPARSAASGPPMVAAIVAALERALNACAPGTRVRVDLQLGDGFGATLQFATRRYVCLAARSRRRSLAQ